MAVRIEMNPVGLDPLQPIGLRLDFGMKGIERHIGLTTLFRESCFRRGNGFVAVPKALRKGHHMFIHWSEPKNENVRHGSHFRQKLADAKGEGVWL
jgi:hypothetical protein